jgi:hypothetical protein
MAGKTALPPCFHRGPVSTEIVCFNRESVSAGMVSSGLSLQGRALHDLALHDLALHEHALNARLPPMPSSKLRVHSGVVRVNRHYGVISSCGLAVRSTRSGQPVTDGAHGGLRGSNAAIDVDSAPAALTCLNPRYSFEVMTGSLRGSKTPCRPYKIPGGGLTNSLPLPQREFASNHCGSGIKLDGIA